jgi:hypothetical protein|tara:strand:- start:675 stop:932 length:258 start_codon:yes stop_codon:yes gene_type:complete
MANPTCFGITDTAPAAKRAFTPVRGEWRWLRPLKIERQFAQCLVQLTLQVLTESHGVLVEVAPCSCQSQPIGNRSLLQQGKQTGC